MLHSRVKVNNFALICSDFSFLEVFSVLYICRICKHHVFGKVNALLMFIKKRIKRLKLSVYYGMTVQPLPSRTELISRSIDCSLSNHFQMESLL